MSGSAASSTTSAYGCSAAWAWAQAASAAAPLATPSARHPHAASIDICAVRALSSGSATSVGRPGQSGSGKGCNGSAPTASDAVNQKWLPRPGTLSTPTSPCIRRAQVPGDRQAEARAAEAAGGRAVGLLEGGEQVGLLAGSDADAGCR